MVISKFLTSFTQMSPLIYAKNAGEQTKQH